MSEVAREAMTADEPGAGEDVGLVVGFGSSAGGLEAYQEMLGSLPDHDVAYVVCQHLSPIHESMLVDILSRAASMPVVAIEHEMPVRPGVVYIGPPNRDIRFSGSSFVLDPADRQGPKPSVDVFFASLAQTYGERAIGVVLSGTGRDGAEGLQQVAASGGTIIAQRPETASFSSMPIEAIRHARTDFVGSPMQIAEFIHRVVAGGSASVDAATGDDSVVDALVALVEAETGVDLTNYRASTLRRRISRRMALSQSPDMRTYLDLLATDPDERSSFVADIYVHVSALFRDPDAFLALRDRIKQLIAGREPGEPLRFWVPGCADGQEAYTLAMLTLEVARELGRTVPFKIFATDIADSAVARGRDATYPLDQAVHLPAEYEGVYYERHDDVVTMGQVLRESIIFSTHDLLRDPPFLNMDLVSCRNLLIYLTPTSQDRVCDLFLYSLKPGGLFFVGLSETPRELADLEVLDRPHKIYRKRPGAVRTKPLLHPTRFGQPTVARSGPGEVFDPEREALTVLARRFAPAAVIVDGDGNIVYSTAGMADFLHHADGLATNRLVDRVRPQLRSALRAILFRVAHDGVAGESSELLVDDEGTSVRIVAERTASAANDWTTVSFAVAVGAGAPPSDDEPEGDLGDTSVGTSLGQSPRAVLEHELLLTRESLQTVIEELETANEQLQVYNEQLQSSNEEYVSTNEELQTLNEELQATNEELTTVNDELRDRSERHETAVLELQYMQESVQLLPMFVTDRSLRVRFASDRVRDVVDVERFRLGDPLLALPWLDDVGVLPAVAAEVLEAGRERLIELQSSGRTFRVQVAAYRNRNDAVDGVSVIFNDVSVLKQTERELVEERNRAELTLGHLSDAVIRIDQHHVVDFVNDAAASLLGRPASDVIGGSVSTVVELSADGRSIDLDEVIGTTRVTGEAFAPRDTFYRFRRSPTRELLLEATLTPAFEAGTGVFTGALLTLKDVTERQGYLKQLLWNSKHDGLTNLINRTEVETRIGRAIEVAHRESRPSVLMYLDLDQFKIINDTCGHAAGDQLLQQVAALLGRHIRPGDTVARLGGDEFAVLVDGCDLTQGRKLAQEMLDAIAAFTFVWRERVFKIGVSIGIVAIDEFSRSVSDVLSEADTACYAAKQDGRNCIRMSDSASNFLAAERNEMVVISDISDALERDGFELHFQEIRGREDTPSWWEALVRMRRGDSLIFPGDFLPAAERFGIVKRIDLWVAEHVVALAERLGDAAPVFAVNVSGLSVADEQYVAFIEHRIGRSTAPAHRFVFELTETAAMASVLRTHEFISRVHDMGARVALDDFGTGTSSLAYLRELPIDVLKLDALLTRSLGTDDVTRHIVEAVTMVANHLEIEVVAEGVETKKQLHALGDLDIAYAQGYHIARPTPEATFVERISLIDLADDAVGSQTV